MVTAYITKKSISEEQLGQLWDDNVNEDFLTEEELVNRSVEESARNIISEMSRQFEKIFSGLNGVMEAEG